MVTGMLVDHVRWMVGTRILGRCGLQGDFVVAYRSYGAGEIRYIHLVVCHRYTSKTTTTMRIRY